MHFRVTRPDGSQRLLQVEQIRSISFFQDARRGPLVLFHMKDGERLVGPGNAKRLFVRFIEDSQQLPLQDYALT